MKQIITKLIFLSLLMSKGVFALEPFEVRDIVVDGVQRTEPGTVFAYLPIKVGDIVTDRKVTLAIKELFATGFFKEIHMSAEGDVLVIRLVERPAIAEINITGAEEFDIEELESALNGIGLAESRIFDRAILERAEVELKNQYISRGRYAVDIVSTLTPLERNRVGLNFEISEGDIAKIKQIQFVGNSAYSNRDLLDEFKLTTRSFWTWLTKNDQYSKPKLEADLEAIRSLYLDNGFLEFSIDSTQVSISPDKKGIFITVNLTEGKKFVVTGIKLLGKTSVKESELFSLVNIRVGEFFSRKKLTESTGKISDRLGDDGFAYAVVKAVPDVGREKGEVDFTLFIDPGRRVYVKKISIRGNSDTKDEVVRRELRQLEGSWYSTKKLQRSKQRIDMLGFFSEVEIDTKPIDGVPDQVELDIKVAERATGNINLGIGYSTSERLLLSAGVTQQNIFGSGNALSLAVETGEVNQSYSISYTNPYYTDDGVSRGFDIYKQNTDVSSLSVSTYDTATLGGGVRFSVPLTEYDRINYGLAMEDTTTKLGINATQRYVEFIDLVGENTVTYKGTLGWMRDQRDSAIYPNNGTLQRLSGEAGLPGGDLTYYRLTYQHQWYYPLTEDLTMFLKGNLGYADGFSNKPLPFYKNFYAGGVNSVRGYRTSTIGPKDSNGDSMGGNHLVVANLAVLFPMPGTDGDRTLRMAAFLDQGYVGEDLDIIDQLRTSIGIGLNWYSPIGPIKLSYGFPLNPSNSDRKERIQFSLGTVF
ncbi:MAG: outer membrane protein assembly factor BamA [Proteobacteria bacterium]|nr:outer membrane protein assembly factor BamA [Pseudomonadota bacterium]